MKVLKVKLHSAVDLITNSSTVIFTHSEGALSQVKELVNEMLKVFGHEDKTFDDLFYAEVFLVEDYSYYEDAAKMKNATDIPTFLTDETVDYKERGKLFTEYKIKILKGEIEKPKWMLDAESNDGWSGYTPSTVLELLAKDEKYNDLANKLLQYLYSTDHEATRDG